MKASDINRIFDITESFQLPQRVLDILFSDDKERIFDDLIGLGEDLGHDWFTEYFEENLANKSKMAQDFTPQVIADLLGGLLPDVETVADICAGTGGLTIGYWNRRHNTSFVCYELSEMAIPLLLLNLAIRNITALVFRMDILTGEIFETYRIEKGERYSNLYRESLEPQRVDCVISNPPYSLKYSGSEDESRFGEFAGTIPSNFADYAFVAFALTMTEGACGFILPHGVLFRANKEGAIREKIIRDHRIKTIVGLPGKAFLNTDIPTCIMLFDKSPDVLFIDAKDECRKDRKFNVINPENVENILLLAKARQSVKKKTHLAGFEEMERNDFNLNIPRYVVSYEPPEPIDLNAVAAELLEIDKQLEKNSKELAEMLGKVVSDDPEKSEAIRQYIKYLTRKGKKDETDHRPVNISIFD